MEVLIEKMKKILADTYSVYLKTQNYHWNIESKLNFRDLHLLFEDQYSEIAGGIDEIAEKIRQLGAKAPGSFRVYMNLTTIEDGNEDASAEEMIRDLVEDQKTLIGVINEGINAAQDIKDEGTADLLIDRLRVHDKNKWMLESNL